MPYHDSRPQVTSLQSSNSRCGAADKVGLGESRRRQRIVRGESARKATERVDKADFDDNVLPELSDSSDSSDSDQTKTRQWLPDKTKQV